VTPRMSMRKTAVPPAPRVYRQRDCAAGIVGGCKWWKKEGRMGERMNDKRVIGKW